MEHQMDSNIASSTSRSPEEAYQLYDIAEDPAGYGAFIEAAEALLDTNIHQYHRIKLLALLGTAVADPAETASFYLDARAQYQLAELHWDRSLDRIPEALEELGARLEDLRGVVEEEMEDQEEDQQEEEPDSSTAGRGKEEDTRDMLPVVHPEPEPSRTFIDYDEVNYGLDGATDVGQQAKKQKQTFLDIPHRSKTMGGRYSKGGPQKKISIADLREHHRQVSASFAAEHKKGEKSEVNEEAMMEERSMGIE